MKKYDQLHDPHSGINAIPSYLPLGLGIYAVQS